ncbi:MAG: NAD(P)/FAD-dependent oxidoreductase [Nitrospinae bacterium]|nr:NAD(P)/FAD-dependent oxidoreductase [Nitrospinota bacterium]
MTEFDVVVVGGGLSGTQAALRAAELGGKVCLVEKEKIGRKGFVKRNILLTEYRQGNGTESIKWVEQLENQEKLAEEYSEKLKDKLEEAGVALVEGEGSLASTHEVLVQEKDKSHIVKGNSIILAWGSEPSFSTTLPREENVIVSIDEISQFENIPEKVLIVGSGKWGSEAALGFQELGCKVFLCTDSDEIFPEMDPEFNIKVEAQLKSRKIKILFNKKITSYFKNGNDLEMTLETGIKFTTNLIVMLDKRKGFDQNKEVEKLGARLGNSGEILVDEGMLSSIPGVYGVGSISGKRVSDSMAKEQGKVAAENSMGKKRQINPEWIPETTRLVQDMGYVGCSMKSAPHQGFHPVEGINEFVISAEEETFKIVADKRSKLVVGAQMISSQARELLPLILLLIKKGVTVPNLANSATIEGTRFQGLCAAARACLKALKSQ